MITISEYLDPERMNDVWCLLGGTPYHGEFQQELKEQIPPDKRYWDRAVNGWRFDAEYLYTVTDLLDKHFPTLDVTHEP